jgi:peptide/nickel transport system permease protein
MFQLTGFRRYLAKRLMFIVLTLFAISFIVFGVTQLLPGNAAVMILGQFATEAKIQALEQQLGLNLPWYIQYINWLTGILTGNWGDSYVLNQPIAGIIELRLIHSAQLALVALLGVTSIGIPLGVIAAVKRNSPIDTLVSGASYVGISVPEFVSGSLLILLLGGPVFGILPSGGYVPLRNGILPWMEHMALPSITLTILLVAHVMRQTRSGMIETIQSEYVRTARLKGMSERTVIFKHALRNGLLPTITVLALDLGYLMGSIVVVEEVFAYPGLGRLIVFAIQNRDLPTLQIGVLIVAATYAFANLGADLVYTYLDPRIDYGDS